MNAMLCGQRSRNDLERCAPTASRTRWPLSPAKCRRPSPPRGPRAFACAAGLRHETEHPARAARPRLRCDGLPGGTDAERSSRRGPTGSCLQRPRRPGGKRLSDRPDRKLLGRAPLFGICLGHQLTGPGGRAAHLQAQIRSPGRQPAGEGGGRARAPSSRARTTATRSPTASRRARQLFSTPTTAPARAAITRSCGPSRCSSTRRPAPGRATPPSSSTASRR
jgi:hypothetical protein